MSKFSIFVIAILIAILMSLISFIPTTANADSSQYPKTAAAVSRSFIIRSGMVNCAALFEAAEKARPTLRFWGRVGQWLIPPEPDRDSPLFKLDGASWRAVYPDVESENGLYVEVATWTERRQKWNLTLSRQLSSDDRNELVLTDERFPNRRMALPELEDFDLMSGDRDRLSVIANVEGHLILKIEEMDRVNIADDPIVVAVALYDLTSGQIVH